MFIEMTTFSIPTFLIKLSVFGLCVLFGWLALTVIAFSVYNFMTARAIKHQMRIDAEIDRLHK